LLLPAELKIPRLKLASCEDAQVLLGLHGASDYGFAALITRMEVETGMSLVNLIDFLKNIKTDYLALLPPDIGRATCGSFNGSERRLRLSISSPMVN